MFEHFKETGRELPAPLTEKEWVAEQGSVEGPILQYQKFSEQASTDESISVVASLKSVAVPEGWSAMSQDEFDKQIAHQEALADSLQENPEDDSPKPADGVLVCDNFQDGKSKAPYNLQVRNTAGEAVKFIAIVRDAPYSKIPSLVEGGYSLDITESDTGYTYTFTGTLEDYASITITGGLVSPVGNGKTENSPELYLG